MKFMRKEIKILKYIELNIPVLQKNILKIAIILAFGKKKKEKEKLYFLPNTQNLFLTSTNLISI